jgi:hypothetical protein
MPGSQDNHQPSVTIYYRELSSLRLCNPVGDDVLVMSTLETHSEVVPETRFYDHGQAEW